MTETVKRAIAITGAALATAGIGTLLSAPAADAFPGQEGIIRCESGGNPSIVNNTAAGIRAGRPAGLFQIVTGTWRAYGGAQFAPTADLAAPWEQQIVADRIYAAQGTAPWECRPSGGSGGVPAAPKPKPKVQAPKPAPKPYAAQPAPKPKMQTPAPKHSAPKHQVTKGKKVMVLSGDTLYAIAQRHFGDGYQWPKLYDANKQTVGDNPDLIFPGQMLVIP